MSKEREYSSIEKAVEDLRAGKIILCTDDPDRENEGDMICAAEFATRENINFMASLAKGLICTPMSIEAANSLLLDSDCCHAPRHLTGNKALRLCLPHKLARTLGWDIVTVR